MAAVTLSLLLTGCVGTSPPLDTSTVAAPFSPSAADAPRGWVFNGTKPLDVHDAARLTAWAANRTIIPAAAEVSTFENATLGEIGVITLRYNATQDARDWRHGEPVRGLPAIGYLCESDIRMLATVTGSTVLLVDGGNRYSMSDARVEWAKQQLSDALLRRSAGQEVCTVDAFGPRMRASPPPGPRADRFEPNDGKASPYLLHGAAELTGSIFPAGDVDWFRLDITSNTTALFGAHAGGDAEGAPIVAVLRTANGTILATGHRTGDYERLNVGPGPLYLEVRAAAEGAVVPDYYVFLTSPAP